MQEHIGGNIIRKEPKYKRNEREDVIKKKREGERKTNVANLEYNMKARNCSLDLNLSINEQLDKEKEVETKIFYEIKSVEKENRKENSLKYKNISGLWRRLSQ